ncbi:hypothetical protein NGRA_1329 [Nosema granulosis]|uniref:Uncharacterized protein n=1 Tax=Nosema granulosis TaxID=83296 RepID=A0A9P6H1Z4_9MICR|nr:hypothetical protein NGRA_1329 [Nosema granulosis]
MNIFAIYKGQKQIFSSGYIDPLVINIILGLNEIGTNFLEDKISYMELDSFSINVHVSLTETVFVCINKNRTRTDLGPFLESYAKSQIYGDENLLNVLIFDNY